MPTIKPPAATTNASAAAPVVGAGATPSTSDKGHRGLPLPFPSVLANPSRLGPPRFTPLERKTLGVK